MIVRFDDVCINSNMAKTDAMARWALKQGHEVWYCISPLVSDMSSEQGPARERVFAGILKAYSDPRVFYRVDKCGVPAVGNPRIKVCSHGLIHVDHRLLDKAAQEVSILVSANLLQSRVFVPPFNKWNAATEEICREHDIELVRFEDGWLGMEHNARKVGHEKWYLHAREWTLEQFVRWFS